MSIRTEGAGARTAKKRKIKGNGVWFYENIWEPFEKLVAWDSVTSNP